MRPFGIEGIIWDHEVEHADECAMAHVEDRQILLPMKLNRAENPWWQTRNYQNPESG